MFLSSKELLKMQQALDMILEPRKFICCPENRGKSVQQEEQCVSICTAPFEPKRVSDSSEQMKVLITKTIKKGQSLLKRLRSLTNYQKLIICKLQSEPSTAHKLLLLLELKKLGQLHRPESYWCLAQLYYTEQERIAKIIQQICCRQCNIHSAGELLMVNFQRGMMAIERAMRIILQWMQDDVTAEIALKNHQKAITLLLRSIGTELMMRQNEFGETLREMFLVVVGVVDHYRVLESEFPQQKAQWQKFVSQIIDWQNSLSKKISNKYTQTSSCEVMTVIMSQHTGRRSELHNNMFRSYLMLLLRHCDIESRRKVYLQTSLKLLIVCWDSVILPTEVLEIVLQECYQWLKDQVQQSSKGKNACGTCANCEWACNRLWEDAIPITIMAKPTIKDTLQSCLAQFLRIIVTVPQNVDQISSAKPQKVFNILLLLGQTDLFDAEGQSCSQLLEYIQTQLVTLITPQRWIHSMNLFEWKILLNILSMSKLSLPVQTLQLICHSLCDIAGFHLQFMLNSPYISSDSQAAWIARLSYDHLSEICQQLLALSAPELIQLAEQQLAKFNSICHHSLQLDIKHLIKCRQIVINSSNFLLLIVEQLESKYKSLSLGQPNSLLVSQTLICLLRITHYLRAGQTFKQPFQQSCEFQDELSTGTDCEFISSLVTLTVLLCQIPECRDKLTRSDLRAVLSYSLQCELFSDQAASLAVIVFCCGDVQSIVLQLRTVQFWDRMKSAAEKQFYLQIYIKLVDDLKGKDNEYTTDLKYFIERANLVLDSVQVSLEANY